MANMMKNAPEAFQVMGANFKPCSHLQTFLTDIIKNVNKLIWQRCLKFFAYICVPLSKNELFCMSHQNKLRHAEIISEVCLDIANYLRIL